MREFDASCLTAVEPCRPKKLPRSAISQGVFAHYLNVKPKLVSEWERGEKRPSRPSLKLLSLSPKGLMQLHEVFGRPSAVILDGQPG